MALAPFQLYVDLPQIQSASRAGSTVTVTTASPHGLTTGAYVQMEGATGSAGTSMVGVYEVTVTSGSAFTYTKAGNAGNATVGSACISQDLFNPPINYLTANRQAAVYAVTEGITMSAAGDGQTAQMSIQVLQDDTPSAGPWFSLIPDQARVRLYKADTGTTPTDADLYFIGIVSGVQANINGSGQGTIADVSVIEVNAILDKLVVFGRELQPRSPDGEGAFDRVGNLTTVTTSSDHGYPPGAQVKISSVIGGGNATFNGTFSIGTALNDNQFTYTNTGNDAEGDNWRNITSISLVSKSQQLVQIQITSGAFHGLQGGDTVRLRGVTASTAAATNLINSTFSGSNVIKASNTVLQVKLPTKIATSVTFTGGEIRGVASIVPIGSGGGQRVIAVNASEDEGDAVRKALAMVHTYKSSSAPVQRLLSTNTTSQIASAADAKSAAGASIPVGSLRSVLDSIVEIYGGQDTKERRYYIDLNRRLNYRLVDATAQPAFATAPYKIITTGVADPDTTTAAATIYPFSLSLNYDHQTTKQALFQISSDAAGGTAITKVVNYTEAGYTARRNAPVFDDVVDFPTAASDQVVQLQRAAKSYFLEAHKPLLTGTLVLRGAGKAAHNNLGFSAGYYRTGASSYALQKRWEPGQWIDITCVELGLAGGLYRVEQVDWSLEPGSFTQIITITFNRRNPNELAAQIKKAGR